MPNPAPLNDWIPWNGHGEPPLPHNTWIELIHRDGYVNKMPIGCGSASRKHWTWECNKADQIIAYRCVED